MLSSLLIVFMFFSQAGSATAHTQLHLEGSNFPYASRPVIASLEKVGNNADEMVEFTLNGCTTMRLYAVGEVSQSVMVDYGTIERNDTGQVIWKMYYFETDQDSWPRNRRVDRSISLPAGSYRLRFRTNSAHSFDDWGQQPPQFRFWGIGLYQELSTEQPAPHCWDYADEPEALGWSLSRLEGLVPELERMNVAALMIVTDGQVVYEWGNTANNFKAHSIRKSLLSALYGIAIAEGTIDPSRTLAELGIDEKTPLTAAEKQATIGDLLKARSGVYLSAAGETPSMRSSRPQRGSHPHGTFWYYNNWDFNALGTIFDQETGQESVYQAFKDQIADPIGMQDLDITRLRYSYKPQSIHPNYGFHISVRDLARFGQLYLQQGTWQDKQIIPAGWVAESVTPYSRTGGFGTYSGYGYMWWIAAQDHWAIQHGSFAAKGLGGQTVQVLPGANTVIVLRINLAVPGVKLLDAQDVDWLMIQILRAFNWAQNRDPYMVASRLVLVWGILVVAALILLLWSLVNDAVTPWGIGLIWVAVTMLFGPFGLLVYWITYRQPTRSGVMLPGWLRALGATVCGAAGNILGLLLLTALFIAFVPSGNLGPEALLAPFIVGWFGFRAPLFASWTGHRYWIALSRTMLAEVMSVMLVFAGAIPVVLSLERHWYLDFWRLWRLDSPLFWALFVLAAFAGALTVYPLNLWMAYRRFQIWPFQVIPEKSTSLPSLRNAWWVLLVSLTVLVAAIVFAG